LVGLLIFIPWLGAVSVAAVRDASRFQAGDYILRCANDLRWYRGDEELARWGQSWTLCTDNQQQLWTGFILEGKITLRRFSAPAESQDYVSAANFEGGSISKIVSDGDYLHILVTVPRGGKQSERLIKLVPFSISSASFGEDVVLKDHNGQPELLLLPPIPAVAQLPKPRQELLTHGIWDAALFGKNRLWISTQDQVLSYLVGKVLPATDHTRIAYAEGTGVREKVIHRRSVDVGNPRGIAPCTESQIALVDCSGSGRLILLGALGPVSSVELTPQIDPKVTFTWGWNGVLVSKDDIFISNVHPTAGRVVRIDRTSGRVKGDLVTGFPVSEIVEVQ
jgi:hypothetical protein